MIARARCDAGCDVAIVGGGMAGGLLARQLLRALPGIRLALFEKNGEHDWRVGESTVELASNYLIRRLGLSRYLYEEQLPKNGLRYFFDDATKSSPLEEMSEIGSVRPAVPPGLPDRPRAPRRRPAPHERRGRAPSSTWAPRCSGSSSARAARPTASRCARAAGRERSSAAGSLDASGRAGLVARAKGLRVKESSHQHQRGLGPLRGRGRPRRPRARELPRARAPHEPRPLDGALLLPGLLDLVHPDPQRRDQRRRGRRPAARRARDPHARGLPRVPGRPRERCASCCADARHLDTQSYAQLAYGTHALLPRRSLGPDRARPPPSPTRSTARAPTSSRSRTTSSPISWRATSRGEARRSAGRAHRALRPLHALPLRDGDAALPRPVRAARQPGADAPQVGLRPRALLQPLGVGLHAGPAPRRAAGCAASCARSASCSRRCGTSRALFEKARRRLLDEGALLPRQPRRLLLRPRVHRLRRGGRAARARAGRCSRRPARSSTRSTCAPASCSASPSDARARRSHAADLVHGGPTAGVTASPRAPRSAGRPGGRRRATCSASRCSAARCSSTRGRSTRRSCASACGPSPPCCWRSPSLGGGARRSGPRGAPAHRPAARAGLSRGAIAVLLGAALADGRRALPAAGARGRLPLARAARARRACASRPR